MIRVWKKKVQIVSSQADPRQDKLPVPTQEEETALLGFPVTAEKKTFVKEDAH